MSKHKGTQSPRLKNLFANAVNSGRSEGHPVPMQVVSQSDNLVRFGLDMGSAPVPTRRYAADACAINVWDGDFRFVFAQRTLDGEEFETALVVHLNPQAARQFLSSTEAMSDPSLEDIARTVGEKRRPLERVSKAKQTVSVVASFASIAVAAFETCIDFYHASAFAVRALGAGNKGQLELEPVVRVEMRTGLFVAVIEALKDLQKDMVPDLEESQHARI